MQSAVVLHGRVSVILWQVWPVKHYTFRKNLLYLPFFACETACNFFFYSERRLWGQSRIYSHIDANGSTVMFDKNGRTIISNCKSSKNKSMITFYLLLQNIMRCLVFSWVEKFATLPKPEIVELFPLLKLPCQLETICANRYWVPPNLFNWILASTLPCREDECSLAFSSVKIVLKWAPSSNPWDLITILTFAWNHVFMSN